MYMQKQKEENKKSSVKQKKIKESCPMDAFSSPSFCSFHSKGSENFRDIRQFFGHSLAFQIDQTNETTEPVQEEVGENLMVNQTGIPISMKMQAEAASGYSFDDVKVHYHSDKPAQMQALAYTTGNQVYIGPGQEKHLKHELGHVVQQKQGRVKPTGYLAGFEINDDSSLEKEADTILSFRDGTKQNTENNTQNQIIQREVVPFREKDGLLEPAMRQIDHLVATSAENALNLRNLLPLCSSSGYINQWVETARAYLENPKVIPPFLYTKYGYAVETLTTQGFGVISLPSGYTHAFQVSHGFTRPDIVILDKSGKEVAWIDITSEASEGHIEDKTGGGWSTKDYVYEITYKPLDVLKINDSEDSLTRESYERALREREWNEERASERLIQILDSVAEDVFSYEKRFRMAQLRRLLGEKFGEDMSHNTIKSFLEIYCRLRDYNLPDTLDNLGYAKSQRLGRNLAEAKRLIQKSLRENPPDV